MKKGKLDYAQKETLYGQFVLFSAVINLIGKKKGGGGLFSYIYE